jgi:hypothetical protein
MSRLIAAGAVVYDQPDFYSSPGTRATGVVLANLSLTLFVNNGLLSWPLEDGSAIADSSITAGSVYFNEISGSNGYYNVRFFPHQIGYWKLVLKHNALNQEVVKEYDIIASGSLSPTSTSGLNASFVRQ